MQEITTFAVIGDSAASGVGDPLAESVNAGWAYYLAKSINSPLVYINAARPGAKSKEVLENQLPKVLIHKPNICGVIVGGNDLLRNDFNPGKLHQNLREVLAELKSIGATPLMLEIHDPTRVVPMPKLLAQVLRRRVNAVNEVTRAVANEYGAMLVNTRKIPNIYNLENWHIDRMHPSKLGHQRLAEEFRKSLLRLGWQSEPIQIEKSLQRNKKDSLIWLAKNGTPWFLKRSLDLLPAALYLMAVEFVQAKFFRRNTLENENLSFGKFTHSQDLEFPQLEELRVS
ncbi:MAG: SGNH/GDSL hydrolase family protein [Candidatus Nanopelagicaceae bacterium]|nr:SGNH/GDSL hydrolase family protein [Candidatus Nanopelagicaceae bacterium]